MDFDISDDQRMLKDSLERMLSERYGFDARNAYRQDENGYSAALWSRFADLGLLALPFAEEDGGLGGGPVEMMIVMEAFGRALVVEPYFATIVLAGGILRHAASATQRAERVPAVAEGSLRMAFAHGEPQSRYDLADVATTATRDGDHWVLDGRKALVLHGDSAGLLIVSARTRGGQTDRDGLSLFFVDPACQGVTRQAYPTQDGLRAAEIGFEKVRLEATALIGPEHGALPVIERVVDEAIAALCAEAVGCFDRMQELTLDYIKTRAQFGTTIGSFQVLQHHSVDMFIELEQSRSMAMYATMMAGDPDPVERARAVSAAKAQIGQAARSIGQKAIQLHGGVGMTMEYAIGHYFKRVTMIDVLFGNAAFHLDRLGALGGLFGNEANRMEAGAPA